MALRCFTAIRSTPTSGRPLRPAGWAKTFPKLPREGLLGFRFPNFKPLIFRPGEANQNRPRSAPVFPPALSPAPLHFKRNFVLPAFLCWRLFAGRLFVVRQREEYFLPMVRRNSPFAIPESGHPPASSVGLACLASAPGPLRFLVESPPSRFSTGLPVGTIGSFCRSLVQPLTDFFPFSLLRGS